MHPEPIPELSDDVPEDDPHVVKAKLLANAGLNEYIAPEIQAADGSDEWGAFAEAEIYASYGETAARHAPAQACPAVLYVCADRIDPHGLLAHSLSAAVLARHQGERRRNGLDPYMVASLIRQESEFNPGAVSNKSAYGLMQLLPSVGKSMAKQEGIHHFETNQLLDPSTNIRLGTLYLKHTLDKFGGQPEYAFAAYNAGDERVVDWQSIGHYRDMDEFVESIPFTETREYVQAIVRNQQIYRELDKVSSQRASEQPAPDATTPSPMSDNRGMEFIDLKTQYRRLKPAIDARIQAVLDHGQYILGPEVRELEGRLAARTGAKHCISCASGTDALLLAMMALAIGPGDEVVTAPFTFFATGEMIALLGAVPVFADIDPVTYNIDPRKIEAAITPRTRAIMPVSLYGQPAEMDAINAIAARHNLPVIEDAAQSFGALYNGRHSGNLSTIGCTSFFPSKPLGCYGDGGACFTNDDASGHRSIRAAQPRAGSPLPSHAHRHQRTHGYHPGRRVAGQTRRLRRRAARTQRGSGSLLRAAQRRGPARRPLPPTARAPGRNTRSKWTTANLSRQPCAKPAYRPPCTILSRSICSRSSRHFASSSDPAKAASPIAERAADRVLSLPMHPYLTPADIQRVTDAVKAALHHPAAR